MDITGKTVLVTGANRGLGRQLAAQLRDRGARVYAAARDPQAVDLAGVTPIALDITDPASVTAAGDPAAAQQWITDARRRCDRVADRYVWVSGFVGLAQLEIAARQQPDLVIPLARALYQDALRTDLPEFIAWALIYQAEAGEPTGLPLAQAIAERVTNPALRARAEALGG